MLPPLVVRRYSPINDTSINIRSKLNLLIFHFWERLIYPPFLPSHPLQVFRLLMEGDLSFRLSRPLLSGKTGCKRITSNKRPFALREGRGAEFSALACLPARRRCLRLHSAEDSLLFLDAFLLSSVLFNFLSFVLKIQI
ncbi:hypothetical protein CEXT_558281 [Caerostris extrusa]|uniref:Uncharacterized protein n=1 Tax=Caerostris extrusa TaxID=172846 RepID=A0AAV4WB48_CAEEX|nr:hypothetical protein CEXT_558281 [Caerostris extrusa]